jgi:type III pantothenate kinase
MRIITVDNGNTNPHVGIFQDERLQKIIPLKEFIPLNEDFILTSNVGEPLHFKPSFNFKDKFKNNFFFDMPVNYSETLGDDRLIIALALFEKLKTNESILSIDAGTFITLDLINHSGFQGGFIFPGVTTFLSSYQKGSLLPLLKIKNDFELNELPHSTEDAILGATEIYLNSILENIIKKINPNKIIITGGSIELIKNKIVKLSLSKVQLETVPHLIHLSLFEIYQNHLRATKL